MTIKEFIQNYNLHDSLLEKVEYDSDAKIVKLSIDFCYWQQKDYTDDMPETGMIVVQFNNISTFDFPSYQINSDEIVEVVYKEGRGIIFTMFNDISSDYKDLAIDSENITVQKL